MAHLEEKEVFAKTIFAEAAGEPVEAQEWIGHVIRNRAEKVRKSIKDLCLQPDQFEYWNGGQTDVVIPGGQLAAYVRAMIVAARVMERTNDPTGGCDLYVNHSKSDPTAWKMGQGLKRVKAIGAHQFFKWEDSCNN